MKANERGIRYLEDFLCAGASALLISVAHLSEGLWFVSLFALVPFLWRVTRSGFYESILLGILFALSWTLAAAPSVMLASPGTLVLQILIVSCLFAIYGATVNFLSEYVGLNAVLLAMLWLPIEHTLSFHNRLDSMFAFAETDSAFVIRIGSLFGVLMVSFIVLAVNLLILALLQRVVQMSRSTSPNVIVDSRKIPYFYKEVSFERRILCLPTPRAPPLPFRFSTK